MTATASTIGDTPPTTSLARRSEAGGMPASRGRAIGAVRIAFGLVWAVDAWFKWQPTFIHGFTGYLAGAKSGQPQLVKSWIDVWVNIVKVNPSLFAHLLAVAETTVAVGLIFGIFVNLAYVNGSLLAVLIWSTAEGFGGPYKAGSTDIGAAIIYVLVFAGLFLAGSGRYLSLDARYRHRQGRHHTIAAGPAWPSTWKPPARRPGTAARLPRFVARSRLNHPRMNISESRFRADRRLKADRGLIRSVARGTPATAVCVAKG